jgi:hypothetical protein
VPDNMPEELTNLEIEDLLYEHYQAVTTKTTPGGHQYSIDPNEFFKSYDIEGETFDPYQRDYPTYTQEYEDMTSKLVNEWLSSEQGIFSPISADVREGEIPRDIGHYKGYSKFKAFEKGPYHEWMWKYQNPSEDDSKALAKYESVKEEFNQNIPAKEYTTYGGIDESGNFIDPKIAEWSARGWEARRFIGYLEEIGGEDLYDDVLSASEETGISPELIYNVGMAEGLVVRFDYDLTEGKSIYNRDFLVDNYSGFGADTFFDDQDDILRRGFLNSKIEIEGDSWTEENEKGLEVTVGNMSMENAWRSTGALVRLQQDYLQNYFRREGYNFDELTEDSKNFWLYAAYNGGVGNANELLKAYGSDPINSEEFTNMIQGGYTKAIKAIDEYNKVKDEWYGNVHLAPIDEKAIKEQSGWYAADVDFYQWMRNVWGVFGGAKTTKATEVWE